MKLHELAPAAGSTRPRRRVGRGRAGAGGKTAGRGTKGAAARQPIARHYEGVPKLPGFRSPNRVPYTVVNLGMLAEAFEAGAAVDPEALRQKGLVKKKGPVKVLGQGDVSKALKVRANAFSSSAVAKLEAAGGSAEVIEPKPS